MGRTGSGVEIRATSIRIKFVLEGETIRERLTLNGKSLKPTAANIQHAHRVAAEIRQKIAAGVFEFAQYFPDSKRAQTDAPLTFGALAKLWLASKSNLTPGTLNHYRSGVATWIQILGADTRIDRLTYPHLAAKIGGYPWSSGKHTNNALVVLRGILAMHYHGPRAGDNPMQGIKNVPVVRKPPDPLTADERDRVLAYMRAHYDARVYAYFLFAFSTGMRPEEIIALQWGDVDEAAGQIRVQRVRTFRGSEREGSKTHTVRDVDLIGPALDALAIMRPRTMMKAINIFENPSTGKPWHDERQQRIKYWQPALRRLGIRARRAYATRHTFATVALMGGINPAYIAAQLGHANTQMLFTRYARWIDLADKGAQRRAMDSVFSSQTSPSEKQGRG